MKFRVDLAVTIDVEADNADQAEIAAYEQLDLPGASVEQVTSLEPDKHQGDLFQGFPNGAYTMYD